MRLCVYIMLIASHLGSEAVVSGSYGSVEKKSPPESCSQMKLKPAGQCENDEECPYQITIPPLTIQLPKQFQLLKKAMTELQSLKETVKQLRSACLSCSLQRDSAETQYRGDGGTTAPRNESENNAIQEMQVKMNKMSNSLKNAHTKIKDLQGQVELYSHLNINKVKEIVDNKVDNISEIITKINSNCKTECPLVNAPIHIIAPRDCSDYSVMMKMKNGIYKVTPDPRNGTFEVFCDMESNGGGWTVIQHRITGSVNFNRTWTEYKNGFGDLRGEFWLGNDHIHLLTRAKDMVLRIELEDIQGVHEYAKYDLFYVSNEFLKYRLSVDKYSGTAGNALTDNDYNHDQMFFTTWDRDNDKYPSGNCGAYYGAGWWFSSCMSANLNGKYYHKKYIGKRDGIFWSTWPNMPKEHYLTSSRQSFKTVKMMIRPKTYAP